MLFSRLGTIVNHHADASIAQGYADQWAAYVAMDNTTIYHALEDQEGVGRITLEKHTTIFVTANLHDLIQRDITFDMAIIKDHLIRPSPALEGDIEFVPDHGLATIGGDQILGPNNL